MDTVNGMLLFTRVVEGKSFKAAAEALDLSPSAVSKQVSRLEDRLGARLLNRTTRRLGLTEVGRVYYEHCTRILSDIEEAERAVSESLARARGMLRVSMPTSFGQAKIAPLLPGFLERYPEVRLSIWAHDRDVDLIQEGFDVLIRVASLRDSAMIARRLTTNRRVVAATPEYFQRHGVPQTPDDLVHHNCLINIAYAPHRTWNFRSAETGRQYTVQVNGNLQFNIPQPLRQAVLAGLGIVLLPAYVLEDDLSTGRLQGVLQNYISEDPDVYLIYPHARHLSPKVRVFVDYLVEQFQGAAPADTAAAVSA